MKCELAVVAVHVVFVDIGDTKAIHHYRALERIGVGKYFLPLPYALTGLLFCNPQARIEYVHGIFHD